MHIDRYCLECGESVAKTAKNCDYCGCADLDEMDIDDIA